MKIFATTFLFFFSNFVFGEFFIQWQNINFITFDGTAGTPFLPNTSDQSRFELWYAGSDATPDSQYFSNGTTNGDDVLLDSFIFTNTGAGNEKYAVSGVQPPVYTGSYLGIGGVFMRIIEGPLVTNGANYLTGNIFSASDLNPVGVPAPVPDLVFLQTGSDIYIINTQANQVIPEPTTIAMFLIGILCTFGFGRYRRKS